MRVRFVALLVLAACSRKEAALREAPRAAETPAPKRARRGGTDVTFCVVSYTHFGFGGMEEQNRTLVDRVSTIAGTPWPAPATGAVASPRGLLVTGDLTEWGREEEWRPFLATYGTDGGDGLLRVPVFEVIGNHDKVSGPWVGDQVAARHGGRYYAWDWDDVRFVALGEAPDDDGLAFLAKQLDGVALDVPVVLYFHLAILGPFSTGHWFGDGPSKDRLLETIGRHTIAAIFHGHHHATDHYQWHGIDVFKPGAVKNGAHTFAVVRITDDRIVVAERDWDHDAWAGAAFSRALR